MQLLIDVDLPDVATHAWGRIGLLADPFGNGFRLVQFTGRGDDAVAEEVW
jgi:hypothetical protein